jgi:hypothetical protein
MRSESNDIGYQDKNFDGATGKMTDFRKAIHEIEDNKYSSKSCAEFKAQLARLLTFLETFILYLLRIILGLKTPC